MPLFTVAFLSPFPNSGCPFSWQHETYQYHFLPRYFMPFFPYITHAGTIIDECEHSTGTISRLINTYAYWCLFGSSMIDLDRRTMHPSSTWLGFEPITSRPWAVHMSLRCHRLDHSVIRDSAITIVQADYCVYGHLNVSSRVICNPNSGVHDDKCPYWD